MGIKTAYGRQFPDAEFAAAHHYLSESLLRSRKNKSLDAAVASF